MSAQPGATERTGKRPRSGPGEGGGKGKRSRQAPPPQAWDLTGGDELPEAALVQAPSNLAPAAAHQAGSSGPPSPQPRIVGSQGLSAAGPAPSNSRASAGAEGGTAGFPAATGAVAYNRQSWRPQPQPAAQRDAAAVGTPATTPGMPAATGAVAYNTQSWRPQPQPAAQRDAAAAGTPATTAGMPAATGAAGYNRQTWRPQPQPAAQRDAAAAGTPATTPGMPAATGAAGYNWQTWRQQPQRAAQSSTLSATPLADPDEYRCPICWELLARPVTLMCGHTACEACIAQCFAGQAERGGDTLLLGSCPAGCQRNLPLMLPQLNTLLHEVLGRQFPGEYQRRLVASQAAGQGKVTYMRRLPKRRAAALRNNPRAGGMGAAARIQVDLPAIDLAPGMVRAYKALGLAMFVAVFVSWRLSEPKQLLPQAAVRVISDALPAPLRRELFGPLPKRQGARILAQATRSSVSNGGGSNDVGDTAGSERDTSATSEEEEPTDGRVPPVSSDAEKTDLAVSDPALRDADKRVWPKEIAARWLRPLGFPRDLSAMQTSPAAAPLEAASDLDAASDSPNLLSCTADNAMRSQETLPVSVESGASSSPAKEELEVEERFFFGLGMNGQEFLALHRAVGLYTMFPAASTLGSVLFLLLEDPSLRLPQRRSDANATATEKPLARPLFEELYGPLFDLLPSRAPRLLKRIAVAASVALCPLLAVLPQLRLGLHPRFPARFAASFVELRFPPIFGLDTLIYSVVVLALSTVMLWARMAHLLKSTPRGRLLADVGGPVFSIITWEVFYVKAAFPLLQKYVYCYPSMWHTRLAITVAWAIFCVGAMRVLVLTRALLSFVGLIMRNDERVNGADDIWCTLFVHFLTRDSAAAGGGGGGAAAAAAAAPPPAVEPRLAAAAGAAFPIDPGAPAAAVGAAAGQQAAGAAGVVPQDDNEAAAALMAAAMVAANGGVVPGLAANEGGLVLGGAFDNFVVQGEVIVRG